MSASAITSAATIVALYDNAEAAGLASGAVKARIPGAIVHRIDPDGAEAARLESDWLPPDTVDPYFASLGEGRTLVAVEADLSEASAVDAILREYGPAESTIHGRDEAVDDLPPAIQSTADQNPRPRGHQDPSA
jgi:hypothetical protein